VKVWSHGNLRSTSKLEKSEQEFYS